MPWRAGDHVGDHARDAQLDRPDNGVIGYHPADHRDDEGPLHLEARSSSSGVQCNVEGGPVRIQGERHNVTPTTITFEDGDDDYPRRDIIYVATDGSVQVHPGEPADNTLLNNDGDEVTPTGSQAPIPEASDNIHRMAGEIIASAWIPSEITDATDDGFAIHDRRRPAIDTDPGPPRQPTIVTDHFELDAGEWMSWPIVAWPGETLRLWEYTSLWRGRGMFDSTRLSYYIVEYAAIRDDGDDVMLGDDLSDHAIWESDVTRERHDDGEPLFEVDLSGSVNGHSFVIMNDSADDPDDDDAYLYEGDEEIALQITHTIEETDLL